MISNLHFENLSVNTNTVLMQIINQCVGRRIPHCTLSMTALRDKTKFSKKGFRQVSSNLKTLAISISQECRWGVYILPGW